jgi:hypothetical protein
VFAIGKLVPLFTRDGAAHWFGVGYGVSNLFGRPHCHPATHPMSGASTKLHHGHTKTAGNAQSGLYPRVCWPMGSTPFHQGLIGHFDVREWHKAAFPFHLITEYVNVVFELQGFWRVLSRSSICNVFPPSHASTFSPSPSPRGFTS